MVRRVRSAVRIAVLEFDFAEKEGSRPDKFLPDRLWTSKSLKRNDSELSRRQKAPATSLRT